MKQVLGNLRMTLGQGLWLLGALSLAVIHPMRGCSMSYLRRNVFPFGTAFMALLFSVLALFASSAFATLDNTENRIGEEVRDPTGVLQRSISRSFDALNRLQQVTGAAH